MKECLTNDYITFKCAWTCIQLRWNNLCIIRELSFDNESCALSNTGYTISVRNGAIVTFVLK